MDPVFRPAAVTDPDAGELLDEYFAMRAAAFTPAGSYRTARPDPAAFVEPAGVFLVVRAEGAAVGCGGIRMLAPERAEVKHLFLRDAVRGRGWGRLLLAELERRAAGLGARETVLDTNDALEAAGGLYRSSGYVPIPPYNDNPNATTWYRKGLYSGMTVNERLFTAGLLDAWDTAIAAGERGAAASLLDRVGLADQSARIVDAAIEDPQGQGFHP